jgi:hypothetical protein
LAETFQDERHTVKPFAAAIHVREQRVELVGDAFLFVEGS